MSVSENRIEKKVWIQASAEIVFQTLTRASALEEWFCDKATSDAREGGEITAQWTEGKARRKGRAIITRFEPGHVLELSWVDDGCGEGENESAATSTHILSYEIHPKSGMTELSMIDSDDADMDEETLAYLAEGWNAVLIELKDYCEHRERAARKHSRS